MADPSDPLRGVSPASGVLSHRLGRRHRGCRPEFSSSRDAVVGVIPSAGDGLWNSGRCTRRSSSPPRGVKVEAAEYECEGTRTSVVPTPGMVNQWRSDTRIGGLVCTYSVMPIAIGSVEVEVAGLCDQVGGPFVRGSGNGEPDRPAEVGGSKGGTAIICTGGGKARREGDGVERGGSWKPMWVAYETQAVECDIGRAKLRNRSKVTYDCPEKTFVSCIEEVKG